MSGFLARRQIKDTIFCRVELQSKTFLPQTNTWIYLPENDSANLLITWLG